MRLVALLTYRTWLREVWAPSARDSLRRHYPRVGSRWWPSGVLLKQVVACRQVEPTPGYGWTCQRVKCHAGMHRHRSYVWATGGNRTHFAPMPTNGHGTVSW